MKLVLLWWLVLCFYGLVYGGSIGSLQPKNEWLDHIRCQMDTLFSETINKTTQGQRKHD